MTGGHEMWRDKSLHKITHSGRIAVLLKREVQGVSKGERAISNGMGNVMGGGRGGLNHDSGEVGLWMVESWMHCGQLLSFNTKTQIIQVWVNEFEEQEHTGFRTDRMQITRVVYPPGWLDSSFFFFFYKMAFSYIFDPLLAVITTHHTVNLHFSPLPACPPVVCVCRLCLCVCVYMHTLQGEGVGWGGRAQLY